MTIRPTLLALLLAALFFCPPLHADAEDDDAIASAVALFHEAAGRHRLVLLGEKHGTREVPRLVAALVQREASTAPVRLALEIPRSEQRAIDRFLRSDGDAAARAALRAGAFWNVHDTQHDGRRNEDALDMIDRVRTLRASGRDVGIVAIDLAAGEHATSETRDAAMAALLRRTVSSLHRGRVVSLTGNVHAMRARPSYAPPEMQKPMGSYLGDLDPFSVDIDAQGGQFWACMQRCGPIDVPPSTRTSARVDDGVFDLELVLPRLSVARLIGRD